MAMSSPNDLRTLLDFDLGQKFRRRQIWWINFDAELDRDLANFANGSQISGIAIAQYAGEVADDHL